MIYHKKKNIKSNPISYMTNFINTKTLRFDKSTFDIVDHWWKATWLMKHQYINGLFLQKAVDKKTCFPSCFHHWSPGKKKKKTRKITVKSSKCLTKSSHNMAGAGLGRQAPPEFLLAGAKRPCFRALANWKRHMAWLKTKGLTWFNHQTLKFHQQKNGFYNWISTFLC